MSWLIDSIFNDALIWVIVILIILCGIGLWELSSNHEYIEWDND